MDRYLNPNNLNNSKKNRRIALFKNNTNQNNK